MVMIGLRCLYAKKCIHIYAFLHYKKHLNVCEMLKNCVINKRKNVFINSILTNWVLVNFVIVILFIHFFDFLIYYYSLYYN